MLYDVVLEQSEASYLGPFPRGCQNRGKRSASEEGVKGWADWIPRSEDERTKFQELVLCSSEGRAGTGEDGHDGLAALQEG